ncbi:PHD finger protein ALFIN-LIKE 3-like [Panicum miliaceum]|uniref:PHD finger protein ALFIN-LIKE n=1 Tax=Panicum miliaceum TaxID=4540 RepID=A0A3L6R4I0_PANMI|nr:PHD finger protein ALFIN-LIKE 3-like [Panicum miliaceum]
MDPPPPLVTSSPRSALPAQPLHAQATGASTVPPLPLPASSPGSPLPAQQTLLHGQATAASMETPVPAAPAPLPPPQGRPRRRTQRRVSSGNSPAAAPPSSAPSPQMRRCENRECNAGSETLYLYGNSDGSWELRPPKLLIPPGQPDPRMLGVKLVRGDMKHPKWLRHIAMHCDAWLIRISFFLGANLGTRARQRLCAMINSLQTVHEKVAASDTYHHICHLEKMSYRLVVAQNEEIEDVDEGCGTEPTICGSCGNRYHTNGFWICWDVCDRWFHGKCVKVTAAQAEHIDKYECPECCSDKKGHDYNADPMLSVLYKQY